MYLPICLLSSVTAGDLTPHLLDKLNCPSHHAQQTWAPTCLQSISFIKPFFFHPEQTSDRSLNTWKSFVLGFAPVEWIKIILFPFYFLILEKFCCRAVAQTSSWEWQCNKLVLFLYLCGASNWKSKISRPLREPFTDMFGFGLQFPEFLGNNMAIAICKEPGEGSII